MAIAANVPRRRNATTAASSQTLPVVGFVPSAKISGHCFPAFFCALIRLTTYAMQLAQRIAAERSCAHNAGHVVGVFIFVERYDGPVTAKEVVRARIAEMRAVILCRTFEIS